ncbi:translation factor GUF1 homolog, mitochondrial isoform X2 [Tribolium castaneum]|uniref:Translation factor GUF1 homolog, mitochondrial n=1 Tax=Tribolium castaneum TaxID=7070 RepID=D2A0T7_TRICA|nr:PREDICTED: translation factor GUF1 homolog, mitochondrial isoform X2 [Tribolium castaneum]EFA01635.2 Translation factor waclaw, mitochondrial-like Protein [Tribolium castaneum]|eukprot:XP_008192550.1 PREDICTED: translation factor GUF1 homolog, mitochondrial isoform X2 [Tribolium castaneum]
MFNLIKNIVYIHAKSPKSKICRVKRAVITRTYCEAPIDYTQIPIERIRNFSIIAHVDHGKSTLADRLLEFTGAITKNSGQNQVLDKLQVERERGITVKAQSVSLLYNYKGNEYLLNLIDTPGHVDFSSEVSRSLSACQGVILVVDANDGVQAQTVANFYLAFGKDLTIVPVLNKIDLKNADPDRVTKQLQSLFDIEPQEVLRISAKLGTGIQSVIEALIERISPPKVDRTAPFRALLFDSWFDKYRGALSLIYIQDGEINVGDEVQSCHSQKTYSIKSLSLLRPQEVVTKKLVAGQIGLIGCNMRTSKEAFIGDTIHLSSCPVEPLQGFEPPQPMVFAGVYPMDQSQHVNLRSAIDKLTLNDSAVSVDIDSSPALGQGWRLGFLGLLHLEVFSQRLQQEYGAEPILTAPSVTYKITLKETKQNIKTGREIFVNNPALWPDTVHIEETFEPMVIGTIITPDKYLGPIMSLCMERRGVQRNATNIDNDRVMLQYDLPLCEIIIDFHDSLKTISSGYASFDYEDNGYQSSNLVKLRILLNGTAVEELSNIVHISKAQSIGRKMVLKLKEMIPRQMIQIAVQAVCNGKILARETIKAYRKDVTAKLYGGDVTRRMKLLAQQAAGKKKMRMVANISLPRETFIDVLKK